MTTLFNKLFGTFLGIEFKDDSLVVTFLKNNLSGISVLSSSVFVLKDYEAAANEVLEYIRHQGTEIHKVFVSIPDKWAITKFIDIPAMKGKGKGAVANLMKFEIERHIPFEIDEVAHDFLVTGEADSKYSTVFVTAHKDKVNFIKNFLERLSLKPHTITLSSFAVLNTIELSGVSAGGWQDIIGIVRKSDFLGRKGENSVCLNFDRMYASIVVIREGICSDIKSFTLRTGQTEVDFFNEIIMQLEDIQASFDGQSIKRLIITGDTALPGISDKMESMLKEKSVMVDKVMMFSGNIKGVKMNGLSSSVGACFAGLGIGTYAINLLPHELDYEIKKIAPLATKIFLALIVLLTIGIFGIEAIKEKNNLQILEAALKKNEPLVNNIKELSSGIAMLNQHSKFLYNIKESEITLEVLAELSKILPKEAWVTNLDFKGFDTKDKKKEGGQLTISGYAVSSSILISLLEDSPYFEKVEFEGPIKKTKDNEQFKLSAKIIRPAGQADTNTPR